MSFADAVVPKRRPMISRAANSSQQLMSPDWWARSVRVLCLCSNFFRLLGFISQFNQINPQGTSFLVSSLALSSLSANGGHALRNFCYLYFCPHGGHGFYRTANHSVDAMVNKYQVTKTNLCKKTTSNPRDNCFKDGLVTGKWLELIQYSLLADTSCLVPSCLTARHQPLSLLVKFLKNSLKYGGNRMEARYFAIYLKLRRTVSSSNINFKMPCTIGI